MTRDEILALQAGEATDALVATLVMGWREARKSEQHPIDWARWNTDEGAVEWYVRENPDCYACGNHCDVWSPSTGMASAWEVVEKLATIPRFCALRMETTHAAKVMVKFYSHEAPLTDERKWACGLPPLAISVAALLTTLENE